MFRFLVGFLFFFLFVWVFCFGFLILCWFWWVLLLLFWGVLFVYFGVCFDFFFPVPSELVGYFKPPISSVENQSNNLAAGWCGEGVGCG